MPIEFVQISGICQTTASQLRLRALSRWDGRNCNYPVRLDTISHLSKMKQREIQPRRWLRRGWKGNAVSARCGKMSIANFCRPRKGTTIRGRFFLESHIHLRLTKNTIMLKCYPRICSVIQLLETIQSATLLQHDYAGWLSHYCTN